MCEKYRNMTVGQLKDILRQRNASLKGRKKDLIDRLVFYDANNNFGNNEVENPDLEKVIETPAALLYKDLNSSDPVPKLTDTHIDEYLKSFNKARGMAEDMYNTQYLHFVRYCIEGQLYFVKGTCSAQMKKHVTYEVNISLAFDGEIQEASCECTAGHSTGAHCKHVCVLLLAVRDAYQKGKIITNQSTTESLQTFHHPPQKYTGSPVKASNIITIKNRKIKSNLNEEKVDDSDYNTWYTNHFRNVIINNGFGRTMPLKQLYEPANPYAIRNDHNYTDRNQESQLLNDLLLISITDEQIKQIQFETRMQDNNPLWHKYRQHRLTASNFHACCKELSEEKGKALAESLLYPKKFTSKATSHGKIYESVAIETFEKYFLQNQISCESCRLFIMKSHPFIGASPDRLLAEETVVEVKCPYCSKDREINEITVPYLERDTENNLRLKKNHPYYYQVQGQMMVTGRKYCDFLVYTFENLVRISIVRDDEFIAGMLNKLESFYNIYFLPAILNKYIYRDYDKYF